MLSISPIPVFSVNDVKRDCLVAVFRRTTGLYVCKIDKSLFGRPGIFDFMGPAAGWPNSTTEKTTAESKRHHLGARPLRTALSLKIRLRFGYAQNVRISRKKKAIFLCHARNALFPLYFVSRLLHSNRIVRTSGTDKKETLFGLRKSDLVTHRYLMHDGIRSARMGRLIFV